VLGRDPSHRIDPHLGFFDAGMDSITSVELKLRLDALTGRALAPTAALEHPTIAALAEHLLTDLLGMDGDPAGAETVMVDQVQQPPGTAAANRAADHPQAAMAEMLDLMSEDELIRLLEKELEKGGTT
jgi:acyl carrier protein